MYHQILLKCSRRCGASAALAVVALLLPFPSTGATGPVPARETAVRGAACDTSALLGSLRRGEYPRGIYYLVDDPPELLGELPHVVGPTRIIGVPDTLWVRALIACDGFAHYAIGGRFLGPRSLLQSPSGIDSAAVAEVRRLQFKPAILNARPVSVWGWLPIEVTTSGPRVPLRGRKVLYSPIPVDLLHRPDSLLFAYFQPAPSDTTWKRVDAGNVFSFQAPPSMRTIPSQGIDSFVGDYRSAGMEVSFDYGMYTGQSDEGTATTIEVSGMHATLRVLRRRAPWWEPYNVASLYVRVTEPIAGEREVSSAELLSLGITVDCLSERDLDDALRLLRSVVIHVRPLVARASISDTLRVISPEPPPDIPKFSITYSLDRIPEFVTKGIPQYPEAARAASVGGTVIVVAVIGADGRASDMRVTKSVAGLDEPAMEAVRASVFHPAVQDGKPVSVRVALAIQFIPR
jgi:TonB family protein